MLQEAEAIDGQQAQIVIGSRGTISIDVNVFDDWATITGRKPVDLTLPQVADVIGHATQLIAIHGSVRRSSGDTDDVMAELEEAIRATDLMSS